MARIVTKGTSFRLISTIPSCIAIKSGKIKVVKNNRLTIKGDNIALKSDIKTTLGETTISYTTVGFPIKGYLKLDIDKEIILQEATKTKINGKPVVLEGSVTASFNPSKKAQFQPPPPAPLQSDPTSIYQVTFQLTPSHHKASST